MYCINKCSIEFLPRFLDSRRVKSICIVEMPGCFQPIRFTPPRDTTPPPVHQQTTQSFQSLTLSEPPAEDVTETSETITFDDAPAPPPKPEKKVTQRSERKKVGPKSSGAKSSASLVFS